MPVTTIAISKAIQNNAIQALDRGAEYAGYCLDCECENAEVEPDAIGYQCSNCGQFAVMGVEEILMQSQTIPEVKPIDRERMAIFDSEELIRSLKAVLYASAHHSLPAHSNIYFCIENKTIVLQTTDEHRAARYTCNPKLSVADRSLSGKTAFSIKAKDARALLKEIPKRGVMVTIDRIGKSVSFQYPGNTFIAELTHYNAPNLEQTITKEWAVTLDVDAESLITALEYLKSEHVKTSKHQTVELTYETVSHTIKIASGDLSVQSIEVGKPHCRKMEVSLRLDYLLDSVESHKGIVRISYSGKYAPIAITIDNYLAVIMPVFKK